MITIDASAVLAIANRSDPDHDATVEALRNERPPYVIPAGILAEAGFMLEARLGTHVLSAFLTDLESGAYMLDCGEGDLARIRELALRYDNLPLGLADAAVIACAERTGGRVLTTDRRDFEVVGAEVALTLLPTPRPPRGRRPAIREGRAGGRRPPRG